MDEGGRGFVETWRTLLLIEEIGNEGFLFCDHDVFNFHSCDALSRLIVT